MTKKKDETLTKSQALILAAQKDGKWKMSLLW